MMKKFLTLLLALTMTVGTCVMTSCGSNSTTSSDNSSSESSSEVPETKVYTVTFKQFNQPDVTKEVEEGKALTDIPTPAVRTGYTVVWEEVDLTNITANITVNAVETANTYEITYDANGGSVDTATQTVTYDSAYTLATPTYQDYKFLGWTYNGNAVTAEKWNIAEDVTLVASWQDDRPTYSVTFVDGNVSKVVSVKKGESVVTEDVPAFVGKTGYSVAWDITNYTNIQADMTVTAVYTPNVYTITFKADGYDINGKTAQVTYDAVCGVLDMSLTSASQVFLGWEYNGVTYTDTSIWNVADNVTLTAKWAAKEEVVVSFTDTNGSVVKKTVYVGETLTDIPTPTAKTGYTVDTANWYTTADCTTVATFANLKENCTVYAKATANKYTITYDANGGKVSSATQEVTYDANYTLAEAKHELSYMHFDGWFDAQGNKIADSGVWKTDGGMALTAKWTDARETYTVSFVQNGQPTKTISVKAGESVAESSIPALVSKTGYTIAWDKTVADLSNITGDITVKAIETAKTYTVTLLGGEYGTVASTTIKVTYDSAYQLPVAEAKPGYEMVAWQKNGVDFVSNGTWTLDEDVTLTATYKAKTYTITLNVNGGDALETTTIKVTYGEQYNLPKPTRASTVDESFTFLSWCIGSAKGESIALSGVWTRTDGDVVLYATWKVRSDWTQNY